MDKYLSNPTSVKSQTSIEIARDIWKSRKDMAIGMTRSIEHGFVVILYRKTETEFVFMFSGLSRRDLGVVQDAIRENWDEDEIGGDDDA